jgi:hypothetical protein
MVDDGFDGEMNVGLIQIGGIAAIKVLPLTRILLVGAVNPHLGAIESIEGRLIQQILANQIVFGVIAAKPLFDFVAKITGDRDYTDCN